MNRVLFLLGILSMATGTTSALDVRARASNILYSYLHTPHRNEAALQDLLKHLVQTNNAVPITLLDQLYPADLRTAEALARIAFQSGYSASVSALKPQLNPKGKVFYREIATYLSHIHDPI